MLTFGLKVLFDFRAIDRKIPAFRAGLNACDKKSVGRNSCNPYRRDSVQLKRRLFLPEKQNVYFI